MISTQNRGRCRGIGLGLLLLLLVGTLVASGCAASSRASRGETPGPLIVELQLEGVTRFSKGTLTSYLHLGETSWLPLTPDFRLDPALLAADQRRVEELYHAHGYYQARVLGVEQTVDEKRRKVKLRLRVAEGEPTRVRQVRYVWPAQASLSPEEQRRVEALATVQQGAVFETARLNVSIGKLRLALTRRGFPLAQVQASAEVHEGARQADAEFRLLPGPLARIGRLHFQGLVGVPEELVAREVDFLVGQPYSPALTRQLEQTLKAMRVFRWVAVVPPTEVVDGQVDLTVRLSEADPQSLRLGLELSFEAVRWQEQAVAKYTHTNLFGNLTRLDLTTIAGWAQLPTPWAVDAQGPVVKLEPAFTKKGILEPYLLWSLVPTLASDVQEGYQYWSAGERLGVSRWFAGVLSLSLSHNLRRLDFYAVDPAFDRQESLLGRDFRDPFVLSYVELQASVALADSLTKPTEGVIVDGTYDLAGGLLAGDYSFHRALLGLRAYHRPFRKLQLASRLQAGTISPYGVQAAVPFSFKFYLGGSSTVRGFGSKRLSPMLHECLADACTDIPIGGLSMIQGNLELRYRLLKKLSLVAFGDLGDVQVETLVWEPGEWNFTAGPGLRADTPLGLARLDLGFRLNRRDAYPGEPTWAVYFGLGEAF
ncbi:MAG: BamA/TamA family outer membrane protein [Myxococcota bacterium]|jgi:outer membrane protein assembly factor BamA|nr:BamA/TamA family outer membrane protein [Myxococcota bacterium]